MIILCLTGTNPYSFERLVSYVDKELGPKYEVTIQLGNTPYHTKFSKSFNFCERDKIFDLIKKADIVITQGGYGSMTDVLSLGKKLIAVPRYIELKESLDNQKELVNYFEQKKVLVPCYNILSLYGIIEKFLKNEIKLKRYIPESKIKVSELINEYFYKLN